MTISETCGCGCGEIVRPGSRFRKGHATRLRPRATPSQHGRCPRCDRLVRLRKDGRPGKHFQREGIAPVPCPEGLIGTAPPPQGVRVRLTLDVILPVSWGPREVRENVRAALQERANDAFFVTVDIDQSLEEAS